MSVFSRAQVKPAPPKQKPRAGLRMLVPVAYRADGETDPYLRRYKEKWLSRLDFQSASHIESLLLLSFMVLAHGREAEAQFVLGSILRHVDVRRADDDVKGFLATALSLMAWLKAKKGIDVTPLVERAKLLARHTVYLDREWLSEEAPREIAEARRAEQLLVPLAGVVAWLRDPGARPKAESVLGDALAALRRMMLAL
jgi:hypothetical protein